MTRARVLLVEDEGFIARDIQFRLGRMGYEVLSPVATGIGALDRCEDQHPDLILLDIMMPVMDGLQATRLIRQNPKQAPSRS